MTFTANPLMSPLPIQTQLYDGATTTCLGHWLTWFDRKTHRDVGYLSNDPATIKAQVTQMRTGGLKGAIPDWYGPLNSFVNGATMLGMAELQNQGLGIALTIDNGAMKDKPATVTPTDYLIYLLHYVADNYWKSPAYIKTRTGKFLVLEFGMEAQVPAIDWNKVVAAFPDMALLHRNRSGFTKPGAGAFAWLDSAVSSAGYLDDFYKYQELNFPTKIGMGSAWAYFDDRAAPWTKNRVVDGRNGQLWLDTLATTARHFSPRINWNSCS
jgi:hypothetical protein